MGMVYNKNIVKSFGYAIEGIWHALKANRNLRIHFVIALIVLILSFVFNVSLFEKIILGIAIILVLMAEMINTAIEEMVDLITNEHRKEAKLAKDVAAGMVLTASIGAAVIGIIIFAPHIL
jgi:diacylglycerol kinase (ATP)